MTTDTDKYLLEILDNYPDFVRSRAKDMGDTTLDLVHMALGIAGESGELVDAVKKSFAYNKPLDVVNMREELGDILFYVQGMLNCLGTEFTLADLVALNKKKLSKRYPVGYSDAAAIARADKEEPTSSDCEGKEEKNGT